MIDAPPSPPRRAAAWLPDPRFAARLAGRALFVWIGQRLGLAALATMGAMADPVSLSPLAALAVVGTVAAAVALDARRREGLFVGNLGIPAAWAPGIGAAVAGVLETAVVLAMRGG